MKKIMSLIISITILISVVSVAQAQERRRPSKTKTGLKIGAGAAVGAGIGALIGGGRGAAAGALIGGGAMAGHSMAKRDSGYGRRTRTIATVATGTAVGAGIGAAIGGGKGAGIGALLGGGGSTVWALTRKDLREPEYQTRRAPSRPNMVYDKYPANPNDAQYYPSSFSRVNPNDDPYYRMSGSQGAGIGNLLSNGSNSIYY